MTKALIDIVRHPETVLFVGSGISMWSGLPTWSGMIAGLLEWCEERDRPTRLARAAFASGDLLDAADKLSMWVSQAELSQIIRDRLGFAQARPASVHDLITRLGPQRYVSTNYDNLLEQQLGLIGRGAAIRTVTNRQVSELADIQKANANNFVFKPHGDMNDAETIVLSRTHYNTVLAGQNNLVMRVLETLMITRPVLFLGYGLRDPDTLLVLQTLQSRYNKSVGDFWAVLADADEEERAYWRRQFNVDVVSYQTREGTGDQRHAALGDLLQELIAQSTAAEADAFSPRHLYEAHQLMRYVARWSYAESGQHIPITATSWMVPRRDAERFPVKDELTDLMSVVSGDVVFQGSAGAGKTFAVSRFVAKLSRALLEWLSGDDQTPPGPAIPVLLNVRAYNGDISAVAQNYLPRTIDLKALAKNHEIVFIVDGIDEIPAHHLELGTWQAQFEELCAEISQRRVIYFTRRAEMIRSSDVHTYNIDPISDAVIDSNLGEVGAEPSDLLRQSLTTPFVLALARRYLPRRPKIDSAPQLLSAFVGECLSDAFGDESTQLRKLEELAVGVLNSGNEHMDRTETATQLGGAAFLDKLVVSGLLASEVENAVRFHHRIITEYLASRWVSVAWREKRVSVRELLKSNRWDDAIVWTTAQLTSGERAQFFSEVVGVDPLLGIRVAENAELESESLWSLVLRELSKITSVTDFGHRINWKLENAKIPSAARDDLRELALSDSAFAVGGTIGFMSTTSNYDITAWLDRFPSSNFNFWEQTGRSLGAQLNARTLQSFLERMVADLDLPRSHSDDDREHKYAKVLSGVDTTLVEKIISWGRENAPRTDAVISEALRQFEGEAVESFICEAVERRDSAALFALYLRITRHGEQDKVSAPRPNVSLADAIFAMASSSSETGRWAMALLAELVNRSPGWSEVVATKIKNYDGANAEAFKMILPEFSVVYSESFWKACLCAEIDLETDLRYRAFVAVSQPVTATEGEILASCRRSPAYTLKLLNDAIVRDILFDNIDEWVSILVAVTKADSRLAVAIHNFKSRLSRALTERARQRLIEIADADDGSANTEYILRMILPLTDLSTDQLSMIGRRALLRCYLSNQLTWWVASPGHIASESYIQEHVLPLARTATAANGEHLRRLLEDAGRRHGRRYELEMIPANTELPSA